MNNVSITLDEIKLFIKILRKIFNFFQNKFIKSTSTFYYCPTCIVIFNELKNAKKLSRNKGYAFVEELIKIKQKNPKSIIVCYLLAVIYYKLQEKSSAEQHAKYFYELIKKENDPRLTLIARDLEKKAITL